MENNLQISLNTSRLILRLPNENDSFQFQAFDERNVGHMSPWIAEIVPFHLPRTVVIYRTFLYASGPQMVHREV